jgi:hypothetical protein
MLSTKLVGLVEDHWEQITQRVMEMIRKDPALNNLKRLPDSELRDLGRRTLKNLSHWLLESSDADVGRYYEEIGKRRFHEGIPLHECVRCAHLFRERLVDWVREQGLAQSTIDVFAEEELEYRVGRFFDSLVYHVVKGYEQCLRSEASMNLA